MSRGGLVCVSLAIGAVGALLLHVHSVYRCPAFTYLNPDFSCDDALVISKGSYLILQNDIEGFFERKKAEREITEAAVFFRDLEGGPTMSINANVPFVPASLIKLPVVFGYLRYAEENPGILEVPIDYSPHEVKFVTMTKAVEQDYAELEEGRRYAVKELLKSMLTHSDNLAFALLVEYFNTAIPEGGHELLRTFQDLGIIDPRDVVEQVVTVRNYASLFRQLYNSSYLSNEHSQLVLSWLAASTYDKGLVAGVPKGVEVAQKFGERELLDGSKQLHDCGIIYYPGNPYELCVMTRGDDWGELQGVLAEVSRMVYEEVDSRRL